MGYPAVASRLAMKIEERNLTAEKLTFYSTNPKAK
jgi:hypothetical protein